jgi:arylsulfatase B
MDSLLQLLLLSAACTAPAFATKPHIFMVVVDDFGWADAGWHRAIPSKEVLTPTMDALVKSGIELNRHYVHMMCTPTRASFQSGRLPIHVLTRLSSPCDENGAIPRNMTGVAAQLKTAGP